MRTTKTPDGRKVAVWQLAGRAAWILRVQLTAESFTAFRLPSRTQLLAAQPGTIMFDTYQDLAAARELLPAHGDLWDELRSDYWAALLCMKDLAHDKGA
ncbi:hypothetical protein ACQP2U_39225 [Nocardia sp. CA-084685]|uniref:hypothetical protein n=1 Tax=Nocardia sp. CA-084685 TaxID=3239970 RepID=UPI003D96E286